MVKKWASKWLLQWTGVLKMNTLFHFQSKNLLKKKSLGHILLTVSRRCWFIASEKNTGILLY